MPVGVVNQRETLAMCCDTADGDILATVKSLHKSAVDIGADEGWKIGNGAA
jgi:hypothetical protein